MYHRKCRTFAYKPVLSVGESKVLISKMQSCSFAQEACGGVADGKRDIIEAQLEDYPELRDCVLGIFGGCSTRISIGARVRMYTQCFGGIRPHRDASLDGISNHTLIIYLRDDYEGGRLSFEADDTPQGMATGSLAVKSSLCTIEPKTGYGVLFPKDTLHWADEVTCGEKIILVLDLACE